MITSLIVSSLFLTIPTTTFENNNPVNEDYIYTTLAEIIDWRIKVVDGQVYKRLYNYSTQKWVGEWIMA
ncbi:TPA: hypothetical protein ACGO6Q_001869 [Streptococcus suis]